MQLRLQKISAIALAVAIGWLACAVAQAAPPVHFLHAGVLAPGAIGAAQLQRGGPLAGYFQPVEVRVPQAAGISLACDGRFTNAQQTRVKVGMQVGAVYRLRVVGIPNHPGEEVYPTVEVINRLYPPLGEELKFPVPVELTQEDLELAISGKFVTRVVYLENPHAAYARLENPKSQYTLEAGPHDDPLVTADRLGRPMAIVRIGGRTPDDVGNPDPDFLFNSPPLLRIPRSLYGAGVGSEASE
ncbi:MAG TPA: hypothetical protein VGJ15_03375 [Pirellulales bacterium]|jgi:hypothetical protein